MNPSKALVRGAFILTAAAIITKILSAIYRIPFQNIVGDIGFYIYQQIYPFYGMAVVLSTTGFPVVISKLFAEQRHAGNEGNARFLVAVSLVYLQLFGLLCFAILYFGADVIAVWMNDPQLVILLRAVSVVFLAVPVVSVLRGYFQGKSDMVPTAFSQVAEQGVRVVTILGLSYLLMQRRVSLYLIGGGAMFGSFTGSVIAAIVLFMFLWKRKEWKYIAPKIRNLRSSFQEGKRIFKALTVQGLAICLSGMLMIFLQLADSLNLYSLLASNGIEPDAAKSLKGVFDRGQPLIQLGTVAATSMSLTLVPLITRERLAGHPSFLQDKIQLAVKISIVIGTGASVGLWAIIRPVNIMLFENGAGSSVLGLLSFVIFFSSIILTIVSILQGLGRLIFPAAAITAVFPLKYLFNLLFIPMFNTDGAAISSLVSLGIITAILWLQLKKSMEVPNLAMPFFKTVLTAAVAMLLFLKAYLYALDEAAGLREWGRSGAAIESISSVLLGGGLFLFIIIRKKVFLEEELGIFPFGSKLIYLMARKDRG
ncbi:putative polysaccharide biosynthesis protein [Neobacillus muris]|uniref:putative polysaccharide biosynthesis protein n=1 Tax=Neobacillus muris TaxID=2941334 RepID=UPI00203DE458|nr:polysaccharide biosynthesis protein [Neobacillus muris]